MQDPIRRSSVVIILLVLLVVFASTAAANGVADLRDRLLAEDTPEGERATVVSALLRSGEEGEAILREVLRGDRVALAQAVRIEVLTRVHDSLLDAALLGATERDLEGCRSRGLVRALALRAAEQDGARRARLLDAMSWIGGWYSVDALVVLWRDGVVEAQAPLRKILPREFPTPAAAEEWVAERRTRSFEKVLAELVRPPARLRELEAELAHLREELSGLAKMSLDGLEPPLLAAAYLRSAEIKVRRLGATYLGNAKQLGPEATKAVAEALTAALTNAEEEVGTLVVILDAARVHAVGLKALPDGQACANATPLLGREESEIRRRCVELLGDLGDVHAIPHLQRMYEARDEADAALRATIVGALQRIGDGITPWVVEQLEAQLARGDDLEVDVTLQLVNLLGKRGDSRGVEVLAHVLGDLRKDEEIRRRAAEALEGAAQNDARAVEALITLGLHDESLGVRRAAAGALQSAKGKGSDAAVTALEERLREDDQAPVRQQAARSLLVLLGAGAGSRVAPFAAADEVVAGVLDEAVEAGLTGADLDGLMATARALLLPDPARCVSVCDRILKASWPEAREPDLARLSLLRADALARGDDPAKGLEALEAIADDAPISKGDRLLVRAGALRRSGRAADALKELAEFLGNGPEGRTVALEIERTRSLLAVGRPEEARVGYTSLAVRQDLDESEAKAVAALGQEVERALAAGAARVEQIVAAWLDGTGGEDAIEKVRELGDRAYPALRGRLEAMTDPENPETAAFLAKLRELTGKDLGFATAKTPGARSAARQKWLALLGGAS